MSSESGTIIRVYLTVDPLSDGRIGEACGKIEGDVVIDGGGNALCVVAMEGMLWHRTKWAAQNYACQLRDARLQKLREETDRLERMTFGLLR